MEFLCPRNVQFFKHRQFLDCRRIELMPFELEEALECRVHGHDCRQSWVKYTVEPLLVPDWGDHEFNPAVDRRGADVISGNLAYPQTILILDGRFVARHRDQMNVMTP